MYVWSCKYAMLQLLLTLSFCVVVLNAAYITTANYEVQEALHKKIDSKILCTAQPSVGSARAFYVSEAGYGWFNLDDFRASRSNAVLSFRSWASLAEGSLTPTPACTASEPAELVVWLKAAQNTFVVVRFNMYTHRSVFVSSPLALNYGIDVETLLATALHAQRASLFVTTGRIVGTAASHSALLMEYSMTQDRLLNVYPIGQGLALNETTLIDVSNGVGSSISVVSSGAILVMLTNFSAQVDDHTTAFLKLSLIVVYEASSVTRTVVEAVYGDADAEGITTQQVCLNARYGGVSFAYIEQAQTVSTLVEGFYVINASGHVTGGGLTGSIHTRGAVSVGGCIWDLSENNVFRTLSSNSGGSAAYARFSIPFNVIDPQTTFFALTGELLSGTISSPLPLWHLKVIASLPPIHNDIVHPESWRALTRAFVGGRAERARKHELRIIAGESVDSIERAPHACHFLTPFGDVCGCFILDEWNVGTAAHCLPPGAVTLNTTLVSPYLVVIGTTSLGNQAGDGIVVTSRRSATHPSWAGVALDGLAMSPLRQDTAVLRLDSALTFTSKIRAISVATTSAHSQIDQKLSMFGWGVTESGTFASHLKMLNVTVTSGDSRGRSPIFRKFHVESSMPGQEPCYGDSGSGLVAYVVNNGSTITLLVGIMSYSTTGACVQKNSYAADVSSAYEWLQRRNEIEFTTTLPGGGGFATASTIRNGKMLSYRRAPLHDETIVYSDGEALLRSLNVAYACGCASCR